VAVPRADAKAAESPFYAAFSVRMFEGSNGARGTPGPFSSLATVQSPVPFTSGQSWGCVTVNVNERRLGFSNTTRNPEGFFEAITAERVAVTTAEPEGLCESLLAANPACLSACTCPRPVRPPITPFPLAGRWTEFASWTAPVACPGCDMCGAVVVPGGASNDPGDHAPSAHGAKFIVTIHPV
jgi:hypothetical protein